MLAVLLLAAACDSYLDRQPDDMLTSENIFEKKNTTQRYLWNVYSYVPNELSYRGDGWAYFHNNISDLMSLSFSHKNYWKQYMHDNLSPNSGMFSSRWNSMYKGIREATYFMEHVGDCPELTPAEIVQWRAEGRFLRAYYYYELLRFFGPVILLKDELADFSRDDLDEVGRNSWDECVEWVCNEFDLAAADLPLIADGANYGRATKGAALGIKTRLLLYNARALFNGQNGTGMYNNVKNRFGENLFSTTYDKEKWRKVADAAEDVIELKTYSLVNDPDKSAIENLHDLYVKLGYSTEKLFMKQSNHAYDIRVTCMPVGFANQYKINGYGALAASQKLVDAFAMASGVYPVTNIDTPEYNHGLNPVFDPRAGMDASNEFAASGVTGAHPFFAELKDEQQGVLTEGPIQNIFNNREARFYVNVFWSGMDWMGSYGAQISSEPIEFFEGGNSGPAEKQNNYPPTGYMVIKWVDPGLSATGGEVSYPLLRYADILLMYVEAKIELGELDATALEYWNEVRERADVPNIETVYPEVITNQNVARKYLRQERAIEFCAEGVRFFDIRTWMTAEADMTGDAVVGCNISAANHDLDGDYWQRTSVFAPGAWGEGNVNDTKRKFTKKQYLYPIPQDELEKVPGMKQNLGW